MFTMLHATPSTSFDVKDDVVDVQDTQGDEDDHYASESVIISSDNLLEKTFLHSASNIRSIHQRFVNRQRDNIRSFSVDANYVKPSMSKRNYDKGKDDMLDESNVTTAGPSVSSECSNEDKQINYCKDSCSARHTYGVCEGTVCLVGIRKQDQSVIRTCGDEPLGCQKHAGNWADLCACDRPFCNTFSYLRESAHAMEVPPSNEKPENDHPSALMQNSASMNSRNEAFEDRAEDEDKVMFNRFDFPPGEYIDEDGRHHKPGISTRTSLLTILLVIVPLSIGAATVMVVSFNYYCHLC
ncbi:unnamed protein product [Bursaphelenchus okinawaensis]|uniref:Activin_recp domain-containing protein n=1 Tax=Bursaphelenchus okinawaensis TaxID=465554 RepID=A0A811KSB5_9BILA|nr:unnamed protein product [Bursaphelenchus okinawaensis]CAG9109502.1 unnamed protein product [Bursaphelenchus okinawaensis]